jgi:hypothetical protein
LALSAVECVPPKSLSTLKKEKNVSHGQLSAWVLVRLLSLEIELVAQDTRHGIFALARRRIVNLIIRAGGVRALSAHARTT